MVDSGKQAFKDKVEGAIYLSALGDAWGYPTEFLTFDRIQKIQPQPPAELIITDDTQMSLYNTVAIHNLIESGIDLTDLGIDMFLQDKVRIAFLQEHLKYAADVDNNRAPGNTVMGSLALASQFSQLMDGFEGNVNDSLGCGSVMRAPWLGLLPFNRETVFLLALIQAQTTHGNPVGWIVSGLAAVLVKDIIEGKVSTETSSSIVEHVLHDAVELAKLNYPIIETIKESFNEVLVGLDNVLAEWDEFISADDSTDICDFFGQGWTADEAFYLALAATSLYAGNPYRGIQRLVYSNGDSDSIAAIGGGFLGALSGYDSISAAIGDYRSRFEHRYSAEMANAVDFYTNTYEGPTVETGE